MLSKGRGREDRSRPRFCARHGGRLMSRRSFFVAVGIVLLLLFGLGLTLHLLLRYEPGHYRLAAVPPGAHRLKLSKEFLSEFSEFWSALNRDKDWYARFTDEQINSYLNESFLQSGLAEKLLPEGISEP